MRKMGDIRSEQSGTSQEQSSMFSDDEIMSMFDDLSSPSMSSHNPKSQKSKGKANPEEDVFAKQRCAFQKTVILRIQRQGWFRGALGARGEGSSDEHIAHIVLRNHIYEITNYGPTFTGIQGYVYDEAWALMVQCVREARLVKTFEQLPCITAEGPNDDQIDEFITDVHRWPKRKFKR